MTTIPDTLPCEQTDGHDEQVTFDGGAHIEWQCRACGERGTAPSDLPADPATSWWVWLEHAEGRSPTAVAPFPDEGAAREALDPDPSVASIIPGEGVLRCTVKMGAPAPSDDRVFVDPVTAPTQPPATRSA